MSGLLQIMSAAGQALAVQSAGIEIAGQNVSNVNTPDYVRRSAELETLPGTGVRLAGVARSFDRFATARVITENGLQGEAQARASALANVEAMLAPQGSPTIGDQTSALFASFSAVAQNPSDSTARGAALNSAQQLAASISTAAAGLTTEQASLFGKAKNTAGEINERLGQIAKLNKQIVDATAVGSENNQLRDQRDTLVREVGSRIDVKSIEDKNGSVTLLSSGSALVDGQQASSVDVGLAPSGALSIKIQHAGTGADDVTRNVTSGTLGGIREVRDVDIPKVAQQLDQYAFDLSTSINAAHSAGYGLDGQTGRGLFTAPAAVAGAAYKMAVDPGVAGNPRAFAAAKSAADLPGGNDAALALATLGENPQGGSGTPTEAFAAILGHVGSVKAAADSDVTLRTNTVTQANNLRESASGVSVDDEMLNLTSYQRSFEASMRVLSTASELLDGLLKSV